MESITRGVNSNLDTGKIQVANHPPRFYLVHIDFHIVGLFKVRVTRKGSSDPRLIPSASLPGHHHCLRLLDV